MHYIVSFPSTFQNQCNFQCSHRVHIVKVLCLIPPVLSPRPFGRFYAGHHWKHRWNYQLYHSLHFLFRAVSIQSVGEVTSSVTSLLSPSPLPVLCNLHSKCRWNYQLSLSSLPLPPPLIPPFKTSSAYLPKISFLCVSFEMCFGDLIELLLCTRRLVLFILKLEICTSGGESAGCFMISSRPGWCCGAIRIWSSIVMSLPAYQDTWHTRINFQLFSFLFFSCLT